MKCLVLGGHGFIGGNVAKVLESKGHTVAKRSRRNGANFAALASARECLASENPDAIFNCMAHAGGVHYQMHNIATVLHDNLLMWLNLYEGVRQTCPHAHIINVLSNCVYPGNATLFREDEMWNGEVHFSVYGDANAKRMLYVMAKCYAEQHKIRSNNFLVPNAFGIGDKLQPEKTHAIGGMIIRMLAAMEMGRKTFEIWGSGKPIREWIYADDLAEIVSRAIERDIPDPINIAQAKGYSVRQSAEAIMTATGFDGELVFDDSFADGAPCKIMDDAKFRKAFPDFQFTDHAAAVRRTVKYYEDAAIFAEM